MFEYAIKAKEAVENNIKNYKKNIVDEEINKKTLNSVQKVKKTSEDLNKKIDQIDVVNIKYNIFSKVLIILTIIIVVEAFIIIKESINTTKE